MADATGVKCCCGRFRIVEGIFIINDSQHEPAGPSENFCGPVKDHTIRDLSRELYEAQAQIRWWRAKDSEDSDKTSRVLYNIWLSLRGLPQGTQREEEDVVELAGKVNLQRERLIDFAIYVLENDLSVDMSGAALWALRESGVTAGRILANATPINSRLPEICALSERLDILIKAVSNECAKFKFPEEDRPGLWEALCLATQPSTNSGD